MTTVSNLYEYKQFAYRSDLKSRALSVLMYLVDRADNNKFTCYPSISTIGENLHISISTVKRAIKELLERGYLKREARFAESKNGGQTSNLYTLSVPEKMPVNEENAPEVECSVEVETEVVEPINTPVSGMKKEVKHISFDTIVKEKQAKIMPVETVEVEQFNDEDVTGDCNDKVSFESMMEELYQVEVVQEENQVVTGVKPLSMYSKFKSAIKLSLGKIFIIKKRVKMIFFRPCERGWGSF